MGPVALPAKEVTESVSAIAPRPAARMTAIRHSFDRLDGPPRYQIARSLIYGNSPVEVIW